MTRLDQLRRLAQLEPNEPMSHYGLGLEYINLAQWAEAADAFGRALALDPNYSAAYYHKARAEISKGQLDAARATLNAGIASAKSHGDWKTENEMRELMATIP
jgi:tetratricopeptide (TPR) repeat protein